jgi:hypothetical protein
VLETLPLNNQTVLALTVKPELNRRSPIARRTFLHARLIIRLSRAVSGREPEFELIVEKLCVRVWAK